MEIDPALIQPVEHLKSPCLGRGFLITLTPKSPMSGVTDLSTLLKTMKPEYNPGDFVFCTTDDPGQFRLSDIVLLFKEKESWTVILDRQVADRLNFSYSFVAAWITLTVHSSLQAVGLTAAFARALADHNISCNVVAAYYHDHIFVDKKDLDKAMSVLEQLSIPPQAVTSNKSPEA